ncbi:MAG: hypothetical protein ACW992_03710, partial [Candidatus Thorarchaeota archaeon]
MVKLVLVGPKTSEKELRRLHPGSDVAPFFILNKTFMTEIELFDDPDDDQISKLLRYEHGDVTGVAFTDIDLSYLENCLRLKRFFLDLPGSFDYLDLTPLENLTDLRELELLIDWNKGENIKGMDRLTQIKKLSYHPWFVQNTPDHLRRVDLEQFTHLKLVELYLSIRGDREADISPLSKIETLQTLCLKTLILQESHLQTMAKLQNLGELEISSDSTAIIDKLDLAPLENCT